MAPEVHALFPDIPGKVTIKAWQQADIYAFGVLCYELLCSKRAWSGVIDTTELGRLVLQGQRPQFPDEIWERVEESELAILAQDCWECDPKDRPTFVHIITVLDYIEQMYTDEAQYLSDHDPLDAVLKLATNKATCQKEIQKCNAKYQKEYYEWLATEAR
eukprot:CAMPEP_0168522922 /NCGR_PEP_ID=MMETSP0405-20121227/9647_1 /TAXON_ID=498012 /ORGANISM="Trichosphaerium sp, Strain Am-I-7 wt" /LENGTH=159 /DNA_ID=CAMNT_0008544639 /DNA_START=116 /DNA_END=595 /DNA_ORIENTATION=-